MIYGQVHIDEQAVSTHRDSYMLDQLSVVSTRRPLLPAAMISTLGTSSVAYNFQDLLHPDEIRFIIGVGIAALLGGFFIGQLKLLSRDLRGSELTSVIWGTYGHLNRIRREIVAAKRRSMAGGRS
ncbi:MAG: hypothetical protein KDF64_19835 [Geminicoccaceae bacterium]|nr:hypothetical protein [Geminicoccaceae bacterium]